MSLARNVVNFGSCSFNPKFTTFIHHFYRFERMKIIHFKNNENDNSNVITNAAGIVLGIKWLFICCKHSPIK